MLRQSQKKTLHRIGIPEEIIQLKGKGTLNDVLHYKAVFEKIEIVAVPIFLYSREEEFQNSGWVSGKLKVRRHGCINVNALHLIGNWRGGKMRHYFDVMLSVKENFAFIGTLNENIALRNRIIETLGNHFQQRR